MGEKLKQRVAVIGGGCAGLAAAAKLSQSGIAVTLFESSPHLGGRARAVSWKGETLDNGQHILLGAYRSTLGLLDSCSFNLESYLFRLPLGLSMHGEFSLRACTFLPAPLHILAGLLRAQGLNWAERIAAVKLMLRMRLHAFQLDQDMPLQSYLNLHQQPLRLTKLLWEPLCLAALNTPIDQASTQVFLNVLRDSFAHQKSDSDMLLPKVDLSTLLATPLGKFVTQSGNQVQLSTTISTIRRLDDGFELEIDGASKEQFSHVVIATSPFRVSDLLENLPEMATTSTLIQSIEYQPIYTIYLQYAKDITLDSPMIGFSNRLSQWVFDRGSLYGQKGLLAVVISAEGKHKTMTQDVLAIAIADEMLSAFPHIGCPLWHKVIAEKRATFSCVAEIERPDQLTPVTNLYLAGDYTSSDYPATIEGAVRSGIRCADLIKNQLKVSIQ